MPKPGSVDPMGFLSQIRWLIALMLIASLWVIGSSWRTTHQSQLNKLPSLNPSQEAAFNPSPSTTRSVLPLPRIRSDTPSLSAALTNAVPVPQAARLVASSETTDQRTGQSKTTAVYSIDQKPDELRVSYRTQLEEQSFLLQQEEINPDEYLLVAVSTSWQVELHINRQMTTDPLTWFDLVITAL